jgi:hypothetical protein
VDVSRWPHPLRTSLGCAFSHAYVAGPASLRWFLGPARSGLVADIERTGATVLDGALDPIAGLLQIQRADQPST